jgi:O-antigen/teichoic acid export membrane protein
LKSVGTGTFWVALGAVAGQAATLASNVFVANILGPERFGAYAFLQSTQNSFALVAQLSLGLAAARYLPQWRIEHPEKAAQFLGFGTVFCLGLGLAVGTGFCIFAVLFELDLDMPPGETLRVLFITAGCVPLLALSLFQNGVLMGLESFRALAWVSLAMALCAIALPALGARWLASEGAVFGLAAVALVRAIAGRQVVTLAAATAGIRAMYSRSRELARLIFDFALPGSLTASAAAIAQWSVATMILHQSGAMQFSLYAVTFSIRQIVLFVPVQLASVSLTLMSRRTTQADDSDPSAIFRTSLVVTLATAGLIALIVGSAAEIVLKVFGPEFSVAKTLLRLMLVSAFLEAAATSAYQILPARGLMWKSLKWVGLPRDLSLLLLAWLAVPEWGIYGGAAALILCQLVAIAGIYLAVRRGAARVRTH